MNQVAVAGKVDGGSGVHSGCPTRFVRAAAVATVDHIEAVHSGLNFGIGGGRNARKQRGDDERVPGVSSHGVRSTLDLTQIVSEPILGVPRLMETALHQ